MASNITLTISLPIELIAALQNTEPDVHDDAITNTVREAAKALPYKITYQNQNDNDTAPPPNLSTEATFPFTRAKTPFGLPKLPGYREAKQIFVKTLTGRNVTLDVTPQTTIRGIRDMIQEKEGIPMCQQHILWAGKYLENHTASGVEGPEREYTLDAYGISNESTLHLYMKLRGT